jgi:hypothetical protein
MGPLGAGEFGYLAPGMTQAVRVTTRPEYFDEHSDSMELWSMGSPSFPETSPLSEGLITRTEFEARLSG